MKPPRHTRFGTIKLRTRGHLTSHMCFCADRSAGVGQPKQLLHGFREEEVASAAGMPLTREATRTPWTRAATTGGWQEKRLPKQWRHAASVGERR